jgi:hypothetical protein
MSTDATAAAPDDSADSIDSGRRRRPESVDYALYAIVAQCALSVLFSISLFGARTYVLDSWRKDAQHVGWSDQRLHDAFPGAVKASIVSAVIVVLLILLLAKFIRDGKNWSRYLFAILMVIPFSPIAEVLRILGFFSGYPLLLRVLSGLIGVCALAAVILLFVPTSMPYFRKAVPAGAAAIAPPALSLRGLFAPRPARPRPPASDADAAMPKAKTVDNRVAPAPTPKSRPATTAKSGTARRRPPRGKSRRASSE